MGVISKLKDLTQRTLVNSDIVSVQDSGGAGWYKTTLASLKNFIYIEIFGTANTWTAIQTFSSSPVIPAGSAATDAVNKTQLDIKQDEITGTTNNFVIIGASGPIETSDLKIVSGAIIVNGVSLDIGFDLVAGFLKIAEEYTPTDSNDTKGEDGCITHDRDYIYKKNNGQWRRSAIYTTF